MQTFIAKKEQVQRQWFVVDAAGQPLGRLATRIATVLSGKHKPTFTPHVDTGDFVIVVNADKIVLTGKKMTEKLYHRWTGHTGGYRVETAKQLSARHPDRLVTKAVKNMLPHSVLGRHMLKKLKVYGRPNHPHTAQKPEPMPVLS